MENITEINLFNPNFYSVGLINITQFDKQDEPPSRIEVPNLSERYGDITGDGWICNETGIVYAAHSEIIKEIKVWIFTKTDYKPQFEVGAVIFGVKTFNIFPYHAHGAIIGLANGYYKHENYYFRVLNNRIVDLIENAEVPIEFKIRNLMVKLLEIESKLSMKIEVAPLTPHKTPISLD